MKTKKSLLFYILLNILISAATTLIVLLIWQAAHPTPDISITLADPNSSSSDVQPTEETLAATSQPTTEFLQEGLTIAIPSVVGAGNLEMEFVQILNQSDGAINLSGWQIQNGRGQAFTFPAMILNQDGAVEVHSKAGTNTVIELYWQSDTPIWQSGDTVTLVDASGETQATYQIP
ncbi:MAG: lamin tail domain-containing protein [Anaerolineaceae bacterium]|nr:lamin tail domain-containing protein [Anaerolineaceae bacterium]